LPGITPHTLRHYFVTHPLRDCARAELISRILDHSSVGIMLDVYRTVTQGEIKAEHAKCNPVADTRMEVTGSNPAAATFKANKTAPAKGLPQIRICPSRLIYF